MKQIKNGFLCLAAVLLSAVVLFGAAGCSGRFGSLPEVPGVENGFLSSSRNVENPDCASLFSRGRSRSIGDEETNLLWAKLDGILNHSETTLTAAEEVDSPSVVDRIKAESECVELTYRQIVKNGKKYYYGILVQTGNRSLDIRYYECDKAGKPSDKIAVYAIKGNDALIDEALAEISALMIFD